jgi:hypothetical protein
MFHTHDEVVEAAKTLPEMKSMTLAQFIGWIGNNEEIYKAFRRFAVEAVTQRRTRFSVYMIRERVRWYTNIETKGQFKISNNVTPYMSRLLAKDIPILDKIFAKKEVEKADWDKFSTQDMFL